jgi:uncharacterized protein
MDIDLSGLAMAIRALVPHVLGVWLFGSGARNALRPDSDLDVAVHAAGPLSVSEKLALSEALCDLAGRPVDLIDLSAPDLSTILKHEIVTTGRLIGDFDVRANGLLTVHTQLEYCDLMESRREIDAAIRQRGAVHAG